MLDISFCFAEIPSATISFTRMPTFPCVSHTSNTSGLFPWYAVWMLIYSSTDNWKAMLWLCMRTRIRWLPLLRNVEWKGKDSLLLHFYTIQWLEDSKPASKHWFFWRQHSNLCRSLSELFLFVVGRSFVAQKNDSLFLYFMIFDFFGIGVLVIDWRPKWAPVSSIVTRQWNCTWYPCSSVETIRKSMHSTFEW